MKGYQFIVIVCLISYNILLTIDYYKDLKKEIGYNDYQIDVIKKEVITLSVLEKDLEYNTRYIKSFMELFYEEFYKVCECYWDKEKK